MHLGSRNIPDTARIALYDSYGFNILHNHRVDINPRGPAVEVDFSATDPAQLVQVAIKAAYEAGLQAGEAALQAKMRSLLGVGSSAVD